MMGSEPLEVTNEDGGCALELKALRELQAQLQIGELAKTLPLSDELAKQAIW